MAGAFSGGVRVAVQPEIEFDISEFRRKCAKLRNTIRDVLRSLEDKELDVDLNVDADTRKAKKQLKELTDDQDVTINADLDDGKAKTELLWLQRDRFVKIKAVLDSKAFRATEAAIAGLSGAKGLSDLGSRFSDIIKQTTRLSGLLSGIKASGFVTLGAAATKAAGGVAVLVSGVGKLLPGMYALPAVAGAAAAGFFSIKTAVADLAERADGLGISLNKTKQAIGDAAWSRWQYAFQTLAANVLPRLEAGFGGVGDAIGGMGTKLMWVVNETRNLNAVSKILTGTRAMFDAMSDGVAKFADGLLTVGAVGASYLPKLGQMIGNVGERFGAWVAEAEKTGRINQLIEAAGQAFMGLWQAIKDFAGIFTGIADAAEKAGMSVSGVGAALTALNNAINSVTGQQVLVNMFNAANTAISTFKASVGNLAPLLTTISNAMSGVAAPAAGALGTAFRTLAQVFATMASNGSLAAYFQGIQSAMQSLQGVAPQLGQAFSTVAQFAGTMASTLGSTLAGAIQALTPAIVTLLPKFAEMGQQLGGVLVTALNAVSPLLTALANAINAIPTPVLTAMATGFIAVSGALKAISAVQGVISFFQSIGSAISAVVPIITSLASAVIPALQAALTALMAHPIVAAIAAVIAVIALLWTKCEWFRDGIMAIWEMIKGVFEGAVTWITDTLIPGITGAWEGFTEWWNSFWTAIGEFFSGIWQGIQDFFSGVWEGIQEAWNSFQETFGPLWDQFWENIRTVIGTIWVAVSDIIKGAIDVIKGVINTFLSVLKGDWSGAWENIKGVFSTVWNTIKKVASTVWEGIKKIFTNTLNTMKGVWEKVWNGVKSFFSNIWDGIKSFASDAWNNLKEAFSNGINAIKEGWNNGWNAVKTFFSNLVNDIKKKAKDMWDKTKEAFKTGVNNCVNFVRELPTKIKNLFANAGQWLLNAGKQIIQGLISGISSMIGKVGDVLGKLNNLIPSWKGPESRDKKMLTPAGKWIIGGLIDGLESQYGEVRSSLEEFTKSLEKVGENVTIPIGVTPAIGMGDSSEDGGYGGRVVINQYYPREAPTSQLRNEVARGIRLASVV